MGLTREQNLLRSEIVEIYANLVYTYKSHLKMVDRKKKAVTWLKNIQVILTAVTTVGLVSALLADCKCLPIITCSLSALSLALNLFLRGSKYESYIEDHRNAAVELWWLKGKAVSLLTDFEFLPAADVRKRIEELLDICKKVYEKIPETDQKGYEAARIAIKENSECSYEDGEAELLLPPELRKGAK